MKSQTTKLLLVVFSSCLSVTCFAQFKIGKPKLNNESISAVAKTATALRLSDEDVERITKEYMKWMDEHNSVAAEDNPYAIRLNKIVKKHTNEDGLELNFKVYEVVDINAFASADGSVRVFAGLMDVMTDEEILSVIGHEIGHVKNSDTKDAIKRAYLASAVRDAASSQGGAVAALSNSELGDLAEKLANSKFSQGQEAAADNYGFDFLKKNKYNLAAMGSAFRKLQKLEEESGVSTGKKLLFSSHPDSGKRAEKMEKKAKESIK